MNRLEPRLIGTESGNIGDNSTGLECRVSHLFSVKLAYQGLGPPVRMASTIQLRKIAEANKLLSIRRKPSSSGRLSGDDGVSVPCCKSLCTSRSRPAGTRRPHLEDATHVGTM